MMSIRHWFKDAKNYQFTVGVGYLNNIITTCRRISFHLTAFILTLILVLSSSIPISAASIKKVSLSGTDSVTGTPFDIENMLPGDSVVNEYIVSISHRDDIIVYFDADIRAGYEVLAEVLEIKVELVDEGVTLYDGLMRDMPALEYTLNAGENDLRYRITAYLDTSVGKVSALDPDGKRYMNQELVADFRWWYLEEEPVEPTPVNVKLKAEKTLNGKQPSGSDFIFQLSDDQGNALQSKRNNGGLVEFDSLSFTEPGTYTFFLTEQKGSYKEIQYDESVYTVTVSVVEQDGVLKASVSYLKDGKIYTGTPHFANAGKLPHTGDNILLWLYIGLFGGALLILVLILVRTKRKKGMKTNV